MSTSAFASCRTRPVPEHELHGNIAMNSARTKVSTAGKRGSYKLTLRNFDRTPAVIAHAARDPEIAAGGIKSS